MKLFNFNKYIVILILIVLADCSLGGYIGFWREHYWSAINNKDVSKFVLLISEFSGAALLSCFLSGYGSYLINILSLVKRTELTKKALRVSNYKNIEGGQQRVQEDCMSYPTLLLTLAAGLIRSVIMIAVFTVIILSHLQWYYLLFPLGYTLLGTLTAGKIAYPLIGLNYINQVFEAKFRQSLNKLNYVDVHDNNYKLFRQTKYLQYFQSFYNQITIIVPHLILAGLYFTGKIAFGVFMQVAASMTEVINNLSFLINSFSDINKLLSCRKRLKELEII